VDGNLDWEADSDGESWQQSSVTPAIEGEGLIKNVLVSKISASVFIVYVSSLP